MPVYGIHFLSDCSARSVTITNHLFPVISIFITNSSPKIPFIPNSLILLSDGHNNCTHYHVDRHLLKLINLYLHIPQILIHLP